MRRTWGHSSGASRSSIRGRPSLHDAHWQPLPVQTTLCAQKRDFRGTSISNTVNNIDVELPSRVGAAKSELELRDATATYTRCVIHSSQRPLVCALRFQVRARVTLNRPGANDNIIREGQRGFLRRFLLQSCGRRRIFDPRLRGVLRRKTPAASPCRNPDQADHAL